VIFLKNANLIAVVLLLLGLGAGFFGGMQYQKNQTSARLGGAGRTGRFGGMGMNANASRVSGQIISVDSNSITVKLPDGSSKIILLSGNVTVDKSVAGVKSDLVSGVTVAIFGTTNSDGSVTAQTITLNPIMFRGGGASSSASPGQTQ